MGTEPQHDSLKKHMATTTHKTYKKHEDVRHEKNYPAGLTSSPKCFMAYSSTPAAASGCCSLLLMLKRQEEKDHLTQLTILRGWYELLLDNTKLYNLEIPMEHLPLSLKLSSEWLAYRGQAMTTYLQNNRCMHTVCIYSQDLLHKIVIVYDYQF